MLALLIIAHPDDDKFKNWIVRLQIDWMLQDRELLNVQHGFWRGIDAANLHEVFMPEEQREAELELLSDYTLLFGEGFSHAKQDIRPFLQPWAEGKVRAHDGPRDGPRDSPRDGLRDGLREDSQDGTNSASDTDTDGTDSPDAQNMACNKAYAVKIPAFPSPELLNLRTHLWPHKDVREMSGSEETLALEKWLLESQTLLEDRGPLRMWCKYWQGRLDHADSYQEQVIVQSLFLQSLRRLYSLHGASLPTVQSIAALQHAEDNNKIKAPIHHLYMLVDIDDGEPWPPLEDGLSQKASESLHALPAYKILSDATARLQRLVGATPGSRESEVLQRLDAAQESALHNFKTASQFSNYFCGRLAFEAARVLVLVEEAQGTPEASSTEPHFWRSHKDLLLSPQVVKTLRLTQWQQLAMLLPQADCDRVLTPWQHLIFHSKFCPGTKWVGMEVVDLSELAPTWIDGSGVEFGNLFGKISKPLRLPVLPQLEATSSTRAKSTSAAASQTAGAATAGPLSPSPSQATTVGQPICNTALQTATPRNAFGSSPATSQTITSITRNAFGQSQTQKRPGTPLDMRGTKMPRLGFRGDLDHMRLDLSMELKALHKDSIAQVERILQAEVRSWKAELAADRTEHDSRSAADMNLLQQEVTSGTERLHSLAPRVEALKSMLADINGELAGLKDSIFAEIKEVKSALTKPKAQLGEDGYLAEHCPAPDGQDQKQYEARLLRACMSYIYAFWDPFYDNEGVSQDFEALEATKARFPDIEEPAIVRALEHFHLKVFNRPLGHGSGKHSSHNNVVISIE